MIFIFIVVVLLLMLLIDAGERFDFPSVSIMAFLALVLVVVLPVAGAFVDGCEKSNQMEYVLQKASSAASSEGVSLDPSQKDAVAAAISDAMDGSAGSYTSLGSSVIELPDGSNVDANLFVKITSKSSANSQAPVKSYEDARVEFYASGGQSDSVIPLAEFAAETAEGSKGPTTS